MALDAVTEDKPTNIAGERLRSIIERLEKIIVSLTPRTRGSIGE